MNGLREERGAAILMVVIVLAALTIVGAPFALSMHLHMLSSRGYKCRTQARLAAEGALAHAVAQLQRTSDAAERDRNAVAPFNTPDYDTRDELDIDFSFSADPKFAAKLKASGMSFSRTSDGVLWSVEVEDEQGKVNLISAPPALTGNLLGSATLSDRIDNSATEIPVTETYYFPCDDDPNTVDGTIRIDGEVMTYSDVDDTSLLGVQRGANPTPHGKSALVFLAGGEQIANLKLRRGQLQIHPFRTIFEAKEVIPPAEFERIERFVTTHSHRQAGSGWVRREKILSGQVSADGQTIRVKDNSNFGPGTVVRILDGNEPVAYGRVDGAGFGRGGQSWFHLESPVGLDMNSDELAVEGELRHPININTASRRVLVAMFKGVRYRRSNDSVSGDEAELLADRFIDKTITSEDDFRAVLDEARTAGDISSADRNALLENATVPNSTNLSLSTTTICYKSYGTYTIEASGVVSNPVGNELAHYTVREVISIPDENPGKYAIRSQLEFEEQMKAGFGRKVVTWPNPMSDRNTAPDDSVDDNKGVVRLATSETGNESTGSASVDHFRWKRNDCMVVPDGAYLSSGGLPYKVGTKFMATNGIYEPGYFEMWCRPLRIGSRMCFFDVSERGDVADRNRVTFYYDSRMQELVLEVADACRESRYAEYRYPFEMQEDEWYHVAASWKGTKYGQQAIRVDGQAWGAGRCIYKPSTRLTADLAELDTSILVDDASDFPDYGAIVINQEIIEYSSKTDGSFEGCRRGTRYSAQAAHRTDAVVRPFGYSNPLAQDIFTGGASVGSAIGANPSTTVNKPANPPAEPQGGIDDVETTIPVVDASQFQDSGFVRLGNELIYYNSRTDTELRGCTRGALGTEAVEHRYNGPRGPVVSLVSLHVTRTESYPNTGYISIGEPPEWSEYQNKRTMEGHNYFMPWYRVYRVGGSQRLDMGAFRGRFGTPRISHGAGDAIMPVFRVQKAWCGDRNSPRGPDEGNWITVIDSAGNYENDTYITHGHIECGPNNEQVPNSNPARWVLAGYYHNFYVSLNRNLGRQYPQQGSRLLKFPSGELPTKLTGDAVVGSRRNGTDRLQGYVDEVKFSRKTCRSGYIWRDADHAVRWVNPSDDTVSIHDYGQGINFPKSGVVRIGDEFIFYDGYGERNVKIATGPEPDRTKKRDQGLKYTPSYKVYDLQNCVRGVLGGGKQDRHDEGSPVMFCDEYPVTTLMGAMTPISDTAFLNEARLFPAEGYALVDTEIFSWTKKGGSKLEGCELFRGAFGTPAGSHAPGRIVQSLPFRYWDRYHEETDSADMAYFQVSTTVRDAIWQSVAWDETAPDSPGAGAPIIVRCVVRFDGEPAWDQKPKNEPGELWEFTREGLHNFASRSARRSGVKADQVEVRFYFDYRPGSYGRGRDYWKRTALVDSVELIYSSPLVVRKYDVIDY